MKNEFVFVRCGDKKTAQAIGVNSPPELIFFNPDGEEICRQQARDAASVEQAMTQALKVYGPKEISWTAYGDDELAAAKQGNKLVVVAFASDESKDCEATLKALEHRAIAGLHEKITFLKAAFTKDGHAEKLWSVTSAPTILIVDPSKDAGSKAIVERASGKKSPKELKSMIVKGLKSIEK